LYGNDMDSASFLMWAVMNISLSWRQGSCLRDARFHCSNCEVYCGFGCATALSVRNLPTFRRNLLTPIHSEKKKNHISPKRTHISVRIHSATCHKAVGAYSADSVHRKCGRYRVPSRCTTVTKENYFMHGATLLPLLSRVHFRVTNNASCILREKFPGISLVFFYTCTRREVFHKLRTFPYIFSA
jgi:hypothetical protein